MATVPQQYRFARFGSLGNLAHFKGTIRCLAASAVGMKRRYQHGHLNAPFATLSASLDMSAMGSFPDRQHFARVRPIERKLAFGHSGHGRDIMGISDLDPGARERRPWNAGTLVGAKRPLKPRDVWANRVALSAFKSGHADIVLTIPIADTHSGRCRTSCGNGLRGSF